MAGSPLPAWDLSEGLKFFPYFFSTRCSLVSRGDSMNFLLRRYSLQFPVGREARFFLTFSFFEASLIMRGPTMSKSFHHFFNHGEVTGAHERHRSPDPSPSRSPWGWSKYPKEKKIVPNARTRMEMLSFSPVGQIRRLVRRTWHIVFFARRACARACDQLVGTCCVIPMQLG
jgi:hypothetical protein